jgi:hypothetical protein
MMFFITKKNDINLAGFDPPAGGVVLYSFSTVQMLQSGTEQLSLAVAHMDDRLSA